MRTELISVETETIPLDGALHTPDGGRPIRGAVMLFHGNTMNFYFGAPRFLPPVLTELGFACLAFNRRSHDILSVRNSRAAEGAAYQTVAESVADNNHAAAWMRERGFPAPVIIGHSNGGMLAVRHVHDHPETPALVLLSAGRGGPRSPLGGAKAEGQLAGDKMEETEERAKALVAAGRGSELMLLPGWWYVISAESFVDRMQNVPDTLALAPGIRCPVLAVRGDQERREAYPAEEFASRAGGPCEVAIVENCDHFYNGREGAVCDLVSRFLTAQLGTE